MNRERQYRPLWEWGVIVLLLFVAFWFRTYRLADVPPGLHHDDIKNVILVEKIMAGDIRVYYSENYGHEPLYHWLQALWFGLVGTGYPEVRLLSAGISMAGLALIYALVRRLLGHEVALWTLAWQAVSLWALFYSRRAIRGILLPPLAALMGYLFVKGLEASKGDRRWGTWVGGGVALAACLYTYMGSRVLPILLLLYVLYLALSDRTQLKTCWPGIVAFFAVFLVLTLPLGVYLLTHTEERMDQINLPLQAIQSRDWRPLVENSLRALGMFSFVGDPHWRQFAAHTPVFEPVGAALFYGGLLLALWRWRRFEYAFSVLWLPLTLAPAMLSEGAPNFLRPIAVLVTVYAFPALAVDALLGRLSRRSRWWARFCATATIALLAYNAWRTYDAYFVRWARHPDARFAYNSTVIEAGLYLNEAGHEGQVVLSGHFPADLDPALVESVLRRKDLVPRWCDVRQSLVYPAGTAAQVIEPDHFAIDPLLFDLYMGDPAPVYERRLSDGTLVFAVYWIRDDLLYSRLSQAQQYPVGWGSATSFPEGLPGDLVSLDLPVTFGEQVALLGYEVLSEERARPGDVVTLTSYWRAAGPGPAQAITFVHLLRPDGSVAAAYDGFGAPPNRWIAGDVIVQLHRFRVPDDLPEGDYPLELGWYEPNTMLRWNVDLSTGQADRVLLAPLSIAVRGSR